MVDWQTLVDQSSQQGNISIMTDIASDKNALKRRQEFVQRARALATTAPVHALEFVDELERLVTEESDPWTAVAAGEVLGMILGKDAGLDARRRLLRRPEPAIAAHAALDIFDVHWAGEIMDRLATASDPLLIRCILRALGRIRAPEAFDVLQEYLARPLFREDAVLALGLLGDVRALKLLEPYQAETTPLSERDERGCVVTLGTRASEVIANLRRCHPAV